MTRVVELTPLLKRLQPGPMAATLPERIALARREQLDYASFLEIILADEISRRENRRIELRLHNAGFEEICRLEDFDWSASITLDRRLLDAVFSWLRQGSSTKPGVRCPTSRNRKEFRRLAHASLQGHGNCLRTVGSDQFRTGRILERQGIQARLRDHPEVLEEGLFILAEEFSSWDESSRRIDLLALDRESRLVVVELKRSDQDSFMDLQSVRHAAMVAGMTLEQAVGAHQSYLNQRGLDPTDASSRIQQHLSGDDAEATLGVDSGKG